VGGTGVISGFYTYNGIEIATVGTTFAGGFVANPTQFQSTQDTTANLVLGGVIVDGGLIVNGYADQLNFARNHKRFAQIAYKSDGIAADACNIREFKVTRRAQGHNLPKTSGIGLVNGCPFHLDQEHPITNSKTRSTAYSDAVCSHVGNSCIDIDDAADRLCV
jgi:hypothetical protein